MSSNYSLRCAKHNVHAVDWDDKLIEHNGSGGYRAVRWIAEAGWLLAEAMAIDGGYMLTLTCWGRSGIEPLAFFVHQHAECGVQIMRDQGGGAELDEEVKPRRDLPGQRCWAAGCAFPRRPGSLACPAHDSPLHRIQ